MPPRSPEPIALPRDVKHGTTTSYFTYGCGCPPCKEVMREYQRNRPKRKKRKNKPRKATPPRPLQARPPVSRLAILRRLREELQRKNLRDTKLYKEVCSRIVDIECADNYAEGVIMKAIIDTQPSPSPTPPAPPSGPSTPPGPSQP